MPTGLTAVAWKAYWKATERIADTAGYRLAYRAANVRRQSFVCPICRYIGPFRNQPTPDTIMRHSKCLKCGAMERHRLQYVVMKAVADKIDFSRMSMLHFAPEPCLREVFSRWFRSYMTADIGRTDVTYQVDLRALPFEDASFDCVYASHVLEHIKEDDRVLSEINRVLTPGGIGVLPVPIVSESTIEYRNAYEFGHFRAPGPDYFEKYKRHFSNVVLFNSSDFPAEYQLFIYEDRTVWPTKQRPLARPMNGDKHVDIVPVCYAAAPHDTPLRRNPS
jgi:SAM-dependent methyltransferase